MKNKTPIVSIVGRPNVGKSSLFNRILGSRHAVIEEREGTTRDRIEKPVKIKDKNFLLVDTGGFRASDTDEMSLLVKKQIEMAIAYSDVLLFVCDGEAGLSYLDTDLAGLLRKSGKKMFLVINKVDNEKIKEKIYEFYELGLGEPFAISCTQNLGLKELLDEAVESIPQHSEAEIEKLHPIKIAIVGRPNVGKSSFLNKVLDEERAIVHEKPGTTRDSIDTYFEKDGITFLLIDTAGMRHKRKVKDAVDFYSMMRARDSIDRSDVALILIDGMEGVTNDDIKIFDYVLKKGRGAVIVVNKWDLVKGIETHKYETAILRRIPQARNFHIAFISAKTGKKVLDAFNLVKAIKTDLDIFLDKDMLGSFLKEISPEQVKIPRLRRAPRFYGMAQIAPFPKEFLVFVNNTGDASKAHTAFIENRLRENFPLKGIPVRLIYRRIRKRRK